MTGLDLPHIRRLVYLLNEKIKNTEWVLKNKAKDEEKSRLVEQIDFDTELVEMLKIILEKMQ